MRKILVALGLSVALTVAVRGQQPLGPGDQGATLRQFWDAPSPAPTRQASPIPTTAPPDRIRPASNEVPSALQGLWKDLGGDQMSTGQKDRYTLAPTADFDVNRDIEVTPNLGPWMVCIASYTGSDAPQKARRMVSKVREAYRLPAYVFNYGADEKRKEYTRLKEKVDKQREQLENQRSLLQSQLGGQPITVEPIHVRTVRMLEHCGVLVGGYRDEESAKRALDQMRKLDPKALLDPATVAALADPRNQASKEALTDPLLESHFYVKRDKKTGQEYAENTFVNPYLRAFVVRNPTVKQERAAEPEKLDIDTLRKLNSGESFSLLQCRKPYTLAIKSFQTPTTVEQRVGKSSNLLQTVGLMKGNRIDYAAENAHNLADTLRQMKLESYVLHTRFASIVAVGGYDRPDDPNLLSMQNLLQTQLRLEAAQLLPRMLPMQVPH